MKSVLFLEGNQPSLIKSTAIMAREARGRVPEHAEVFTSSDWQDLLWIRIYEPQKVILAQNK